MIGYKNLKLRRTAPQGIDLEKAKTFSYKDFLAKSAEDSLKELGSSLSGLKKEEAEARLKILGLNELEKGKKVSAFSIFWEQIAARCCLFCLSPPLSAVFWATGPTWRL